LIVLFESVISVGILLLEASLAIVKTVSSARLRFVLQREPDVFVIETGVSSARVESPSLSYTK
jgi:hypothetical protein